MLLFIVSLAFLLASSLFLLSIFKPHGKIAAIVGWWLIAFSLIILLELIANLLSWMDQPWLILLTQIGFLGLTYALWRMSKKPRLGGVLFQESSDDTLAKWGDAWEGRFENILLSVFAIFIYGYSFFLGWKVAPNTYDSITTHVVRVVYWLQHGNLLPWNSPRYTQLSYPVNAQLQMLWSAQFLHSDKLFFMVQFLGAIVSVLCVIGIARLLKFNRAQGLFGGLFFACIPLVWMQASTTQNDLIAAGVFLPVIYFFFLGIERQQKSMLVLSGIALGVTMGTKQTLFFYLPGLALLIMLVWIKYRSSVTRQIFTWAAVSLVSFLLLSSYMYIQNYRYFGHPLAPKDALEGAVGGTNLQEAAGNLSYNTVRLLYQSLDNSGLPHPYSLYFSIIKDRTLGNILRIIDPKIESNLYCAEGHRFSLSAQNFLSEDSSWFGPVAGIIFIPVGIVQLFGGIKKKDPWRVGLFCIPLVFLLVNSWLRPGWDPYQGRYFIPAAAVLSIFTGSLIGPKLPGKVVTFIVSIAVIIIMSYSAIVDPGKWTLEEGPHVKLFNKNISGIVNLDWAGGVTLQNKNIRPYVYMVRENLPGDVKLGWYSYSIVEYPLFNEGLSRQLIAIYPYERLQDPLWLKNQDLDYILVNMSFLNGPIPEGFHEIDSAFDWLLLGRN